MPPLTDKAASFARTETEEGTVGQKLTPDQRQILDILTRRKHVCLETYRPAKALIALGFARSGYAGGFRRMELEITDLGREYVARFNRNPKARLVPDAALGNPPVAR